MKKPAMFVFTLTVLLYLSDVSLYAQRGRDQAPGRPAQVGRPDNPGRPERVERPERPEKPERAERAEKTDRERKGRAETRENRAAERFARNPELAARVEKLLPSGMTLEQASNGFKNHGQFIAALHVSNNLNIPFADLKARMTGDNSMSLGKAVQDLRPELGEDRAKTETKKAEKQAKETEKSKPLS